MVLMSMMSAAAVASVQMVGTRVIYVEGSGDHVLRFANPDDHPNLVQVWFEPGKPVAADGGEPPFLGNPPVFRMEPHAGQVVRMTYVGPDMPKDRESLFYLNFLQVPAVKASSANANQLVLTVRSRMKVFYRPKSLAGDVDLNAVKEQLSFTVSKNRDRKTIVAKNDSAYYAVVFAATIMEGGSDREIVRATLMAPHAEAVWNVPMGVEVAPGMPLKIKLLNDFGGEVQQEHVLR